MFVIKHRGGKLSVLIQQNSAGAMGCDRNAVNLVFLVELMQRRQQKLPYAGRIKAGP